jgi:alpha-tubulin suppressor-like RCC1 family protein
MQLPVDHATLVAVGTDFACALLDDGTVYCTGHNNHDQLGPHTPGVDPNNDFVTAPRQVPLNVTAKAIVAGDALACAIDDHAALWCWGNDDNFEISDGGDQHDRAFPVEVNYPDAKLASAGSGFLCVQSSDGLRCGGFDGFGQLGDGHRSTSSVPLAVDGVKGSTAVAAGASFTCAVRADQSVACWGENDVGQLGDGTFAGRTRPVPVIGLHNVVKLVSGHRHSCALLADQSVACWGGNDDGQLGDGTFVARGVARPVLTNDSPATPLAGAIDLAVGDSHSCAVLKTGAVQCWGNNFEGQLGSGAPGSDDRPLATDLAMVPPAGVTKIAAGGAHTCVIADGKLWCWGANELGQLGIDKPNDSQGIPRQTIAARLVLLPAGLTFDQVSAFTDFTCAHATSNDVWCWGYNNDGELGRDNFSFFEAVPLQIAGLAAGQIAAGEGHGCAVTLDGAAVCWGADYLGEVGQDNYDAYPTRQMVAGLTGLTAIAAGQNHTCAIDGGGDLLCWGDGRDGELGNGVRLSDAPVAPQLVCPQ